MHPIKLAAVPAAAATALLLASAGAASAHVTVSPATAAPGGYATLTFKVPTESDTASTTKLQLYVPDGLTSVSVQPHPGWTYTEAKSGDTVTSITWKAAPGSAIKPGEFDTFGVSAGPLPDSGTLAFKALQTYSDGSVVRWIDPTKEGQPEPEHPAPTVTVQAADSAAGSATDATAAPAATTGSDDDDSKTPLVLSIIALVVAVAAAGVSLVRRRA